MIIGIIIGVVAIIVAICIIVGLYKGFSGTKSWATEYLLTAVITLAAYSLVDFDNNVLNLSLVFGTAILLLLLFAFISSIIRNSMKSKSKDARLYSYYETYGDREQHILEIRDAIERGDKEQFKKLTKEVDEEEVKSGPSGALDRLLGVINMCIKGIVVCGLIVLTVLLVLQIAQVSSLNSVYTSGIWQFISPYIFDLLIIAILQFALRAGYHCGIFYILFFIIILALLGGAGYLAYWLAFQSQATVSLAAGASSPTIAKLIIMAVIFVIEFIVVIALAVIGSRALSSARERQAVWVFDGILGAFVFTVIALAIVLCLGAVLYSLNGFEIMDTINSMVSGDTHSATLFSCVYNKNPLNSVTAFANIQSSIAAFFGK